MDDFLKLLAELLTIRLFDRNSKGRETKSGYNLEIVIPQYKDGHKKPQGEVDAISLGEKVRSGRSQYEALKLYHINQQQPSQSDYCQPT